MNARKQWSNWLEIPFNDEGILNVARLIEVPDDAGVYAIASKKMTGLYVTHYVGRSIRGIRSRLRRHLTGYGNSVIANQLELKQRIPSSPASIWVAYLQTNEPKIVEAVYLDTDNLPICNLIKARLPLGLSDTVLRLAQLE